MSKLSPLPYAFTMTVVAPFVAILLLIFALIIVISWPLIPIIAYFERKSESSAEYK
jgi:hypothetical protein